MKEFFLDEIKKLNIPTYIIAGNHDTSFKNTNDVNSLALLLNKKEFPNITVYDNHAETISVDGLEILLCPWLNPSNKDHNIEYIKNSKASYMMGHFEFMGYEMMRGTVCEHGLDKNEFQTFEQIYSGHFHHPSEYGNIKYLGAPYQMNWSDYGGKRGFHILDTSTRKLSFVKNNLSLFNKISYNDQDLTLEQLEELDFSIMENTFVKVVVDKKNNPYLFDAFIDKIQKVNPCDLKIIESHTNILGEDIKLDEIPDSFTLMKKYIEKLDIKKELNNKIQKELLELWNEAQSI